MGIDYTEITGQSFMYHTKKCPNCGDRIPITMMTKRGTYVQHCRACYTKTDEYKTEGESIAAWNKLPKKGEIKMNAATKEIYDYVKDGCVGLDSIYENTIINLVGSYGLEILKDAKLLETCGVLNGRQLYVLCDWKGED